MANGWYIEWTPEMEFVIETMYETTPDHQLIKMLHVSRGSLHKKALQMGKHKNTLWLAKVRTHNLREAQKKAYGGKCPGRFRKGMAPTATSFKVGHAPLNAQPVIRLDSLQTFPTIKAAASAMGIPEKCVQRACHRRGTTRGVVFRYCSDMPCGSCRFLVGLSHEDIHGDAICGCGLDSHITTTETTGCKKYKPLISNLNSK